MLIGVIAVFRRRALTDYKAVLQSVQKNRIGHRSGENNRIIVRRLYFGQVVEVRFLQASLVAFNSVDRMDHVMGGKRLAAMETNPFPETKRPCVPLKCPRLGEHAVVIFARVVDFNQRFDHVLPDAVLGSGTVGVGVKGIQADAAQNHQPILRRRPSDPRPRGTRENTQPGNCTAL